MKKLLIVDDELHMCSLLEDLFSDDYEVSLAHNGEEAIEVLKKKKFDLVITDLVMPKMNGIELLMAIQKIQPSLKIMAMSGGGGINGRFDYLPVAQLIGAEKIFRKPFELKLLKKSVQEMMS